MKKLKWHKENGHKVVIVSASVDYWLKPWTDKMEFELISTKLKSINEISTGKYLGANCYGFEKVRRIIEKYNLSEYNEIYAYGDSKGDLPMLQIANRRFFRSFQ